MRGWVWAVAIAACGVIGGAAQAADVTPAAGFQWSGFYLGASAGYGFGDTDYRYFPPDFTAAPSVVAKEPPVGISYDGGMLGGQLGYNYQAGSLVLGVEADVSASAIRGDRSTTEAPPCFEDGCSAEIDWFGTGRLRLGYALNDVMPFITGGAALVGLRGDADKGACGYNGSCGYDDTAWGWTLGGGMEWGFAERWSAKAEYLYVYVDAPGFSGPGGKQVSAGDLDFSTLRIGVDYHLN